MNLNSKLTLCIILAMLVAAMAIIAILVVWAARKQEFSSFITVKYRSVEVAGQASARWKVGSENWQNMTAGGEADGATILTFGEAVNENSSLSPTDKNIKLSSQNNYAVFEYKFTNTGSNDYAIDLFYSDDDIKDTNISVFCINSDNEITADFEENINTAYVDWANTKILGNRTKYIYILVSITQLGKDAKYSGSFQFNLDGKDYSDDIEIDSTGTITGLKNNNLSVVRIPEEINGVAVKKIAAGAFADNAILTELIIPDSVEEIEQGALNSGCSNLKYISIPFVGNSRTADSAPTSLFGYIFGATEGVNLAHDASGDGRGDNHLVLPTTLTNVIITSATKIGQSAFSLCEKLTSVTIPNSVTSIGEFAFIYCASLTVTIPTGVTTIGHVAFAACNGLTGKLIIPSSVTSIGIMAFIFNSGLTSIKVDSENEYYTSQDLNGKECNIILTKQEITLPDTILIDDLPLDAKTINKGTLILGSNNSTIPDDGSVTTIGFMAFVFNSGLTSIIIPSSVIKIDSEAFLGCEGLTDVTIESEYVYIEATGKYELEGLLDFATTIRVLSSLVVEGHEYINEKNFPKITTENVGGKEYIVYRK